MDIHVVVATTQTSCRGNIFLATGQAGFVRRAMNIAPLRIALKARNTGKITAKRITRRTTMIDEEKLDTVFTVIACIMSLPATTAGVFVWAHLLGVM